MADHTSNSWFFVCLKLRYSGLSYLSLFRYYGISGRGISASPSLSPPLSPSSTPATSATPPHLSDRVSPPLAAAPTRRFDPAEKYDVINYIV